MNDRALFTAEVILSVLEEPATPPEGSFTVFPKPNGKLYMKNSNGTEYPVGDIPGNFADVETDGNALKNQIGVWLDNETLLGFSGFTYDGEETRMSLPAATGVLAIGGSDILKAENGTFSMKNIGFVDQNTANAIKEALGLTFQDIDGQLEVEQINTFGDPTPNTFLAGDGVWREPEVIVNLPGTITMYAGESDPPGGEWLICDGRGLLTTEYPDLFALLGYTYGGTDNTFNIPDMSGRVGVGSTPSRPLGSQGGQAEVTLGVNELPSHSHTTQPHNHTVTDPGHNHSTRGRIAWAGDDNNYQLWALGSSEVTGTSTTGISIDDSTVQVEPTGSGQAHENMPPYTSLNYIIKVL